ncbi:hypothetical protein TSOC_000353 [Tetrabaena socialis]|uniref:Uncharacterized protein n=1 Tax=Tetrabaena socialis TaxID=47790 RepID=A0A2J8AJI0_9CHLO|nr:hypothetical protein TSOC_000353 [Tetrabaena socialis]|eukprot:PNH12669.1 hypothetical protein TSOC_000353 [Tetrabaena socialis]
MAAGSQDIAARAVEAVAAAALRARLRSYGSVAVQVAATPWDLLAGRINSAKVEGRRWESPLGLTARMLDVEVGRVELDLPAVLAQQRITLRNTPVGHARVVFNGPDFGAFLQHPLVVTAARRAVQGQPFLFDREGVAVLPGREPRLLFSGTLPASGQHYLLDMRPVRGGRAAAVCATPKAAHPAAPSAPVARHPPAAPPPRRRPEVRGPPARSSATHSVSASASAPDATDVATAAVAAAAGADLEQDPLVSSELSRFFSSLLVDLQGAELAFAAMRITTAGRLTGGDAPGARGGGASSGRDPAAVPWLEGDGEGEGVLELQLAATVRSFPPLNLQF